MTSIIMIIRANSEATHSSSWSINSNLFFIYRITKKSHQDHNDDGGWITCSCSSGLLESANAWCVDEVNPFTPFAPISSVMIKTCTPISLTEVAAGGGREVEKGTRGHPRLLLLSSSSRMTKSSFCWTWPFVWWWWWLSSNSKQSFRDTRNLFILIRFKDHQENDWFNV